jgi:outer membrane lipoprotein-sorting protein
MFKSKFLVAALCAAAVTLPLSAAKKSDSGTLEGVIKKVQQMQQGTSTLQADFRQEKELSLLAKPEVSSGKFVYSKPNNVLWSYEAPKRVQMLISGGVLTTYYPELNKAERINVKSFEDRIFKYMGASGAIDELSRYFDFTFTNKPADPTYLLDLSPKTGAVAKRVKRIRIWIDKQSYVTSRIEYVEGDGDVTRYQFTNVRLNQPVEQGRFSLSLPPTVRVEQMKLQ